MIENETRNVDFMVVIFNLEFLDGPCKQRQANGGHELRLYWNDHMPACKVSCIRQD